MGHVDIYPLTLIKSIQLAVMRRTWGSYLSLDPRSEGQEPLRLQGQTGSVTSVAFSEGGELLATGSSDGTVRTWIASNRLLLAKLTSLVCNVWGHDQEAIKAEIPSWRGCKAELAALKEELERYNELRGE